MNVDRWCAMRQNKPLFFFGWNPQIPLSHKRRSRRRRKSMNESTCRREPVSGSLDPPLSGACRKQSAESSTTVPFGRMSTRQWGHCLCSLQCCDPRLLPRGSERYGLVILQIGRCGILTLSSFSFTSLKTPAAHKFSMLFDIWLFFSSRDSFISDPYRSPF